jgi:hypothetical protein
LRITQSRRRTSTSDDMNVRNNAFKTANAQERSRCIHRDEDDGQAQDR